VTLNISQTATDTVIVITTSCKTVACLWRNKCDDDDDDDDERYIGHVSRQ